MTKNPVLFAHMPSPLGPLLLLSDGAALTGLYMTPHPYGRASNPEWVEAEAWFRPICEQLEGYFAGSLDRFDVPVAPRGTPFQQAVWKALMTIPYGSTATYLEIGRRIERPEAVRAVGAANGRNPISIIVPCHRVIGADGSLVGYAGGLERKRHLLALERAGVARASARPSA